MAEEREIVHPGDAQIPVLRRKLDLGTPVDEVIALLASIQHGRVARRQLSAVGIGRTAIEKRRQRGVLREIHRCVYAVGHQAPSDVGSWAGAVLAVGASAALSHRSAAGLWGLLPDEPPPVDVSVGAKRVRIAGVRIHRTLLPPAEVTAHNWIPVTTPPRTVVDLASCTSERELRRTVRECEFRRLATPAEIAAMLERYRRRRGSGRLRAVLDEVAVVPGYTRSVLEDRFLAFVRELGLPTPEINPRLSIGGRRIEVDFLWRGEGIAVELDGGQAHRTEFAFEDDRRRDRALVASGITPMRVTWHSLERERGVLRRDLLAAFAIKGGRSGA